LIAYLVAMLATVAFLVVGTRYRMPIVPALIAFAGAGIATAIDRLRQREWKSAAALALIAVLAWGVARIRTDDASRNLAEESAFTGLSLLQEGKLEDAEQALRTAIGLDGSSFAWDGLGLVLQRREMRSAASEAFARAVTINPMNATAWLHLGLSYEFLGNGRAAIAAYEKALSIMPARTEARAVLEAARRRYQLR
jgi:tetratricopeptide (TPR) repeat protein